MIVRLTLVVVAICAIYDLRVRRIPNFITVPALVLGLILNLYYSGLAGFGNAVAGVVAIIILLLIPFMFRGIGAGDIKLLAAIGALNGVHFALYTLLYTAVAGGLLALLIAAFHGRIVLVAHNVFSMTQSISQSLFKKASKANPLKHAEPVMSQLRFPYGTAILAGTIMTLWQG